MSRIQFGAETAVRQLTEEELLQLHIALMVVREYDGFKQGKVELRPHPEFGVLPDIIDDKGVTWVLWNPPSSAGYVLMRQDEL